MIKVLIVEDSPVMQEMLSFTLSHDPELNIVGIASDGEQAIKLVIEKQPDVIAMDCFMPKLDGHQATQKIMEIRPTPIVIVTGSLAIRDVAISFSLIKAGALAIVRKPHSINHTEYKNDARELIQTLKLMSEVKVVKRFVNHPKAPVPLKYVFAKASIQVSEIKIVAIGASTGGPPVLQKIISGLHKNFPVPILIVQHITKGFLPGFAEWLADTTYFPVLIASNRQALLP